MSWLWYVVLVILIICGLNGFRRGLIRTLFSMVGFLLIMILVLVINPYIGGAIRKYTPIERTIQQQVKNSLGERFGELSELDLNKQVSLIESLPLTEQIKNDIISNNNLEAYKSVAVNSFADYIATYISLIIINGGSYIISLIIAAIIVNIVVRTFDLVAKLPVLDSLNRLGGMILGFGQGVLFVWIIFLVATLFCNTDIGRMVMDEINNDIMLSYLYEYDFLLRVLAPMK